MNGADDREASRMAGRYMMTLMERKLRKNRHDDARFVRRAQEQAEEALCFLGLLGWLSFLGYAFLKEVFK